MIRVRVTLMIGYRRANRRYILLVLVLTAITLITLDSRRDDSGALGAVGRAAHAIVSPIDRAVNAVTTPIGDWFDGITDGKSLKEENRDLRAQLGALEDDQRRAEAALTQNETFRRLLELPVLADIPRVNARIVNRSIGNFDWTITLDKGQEAGISRNMVVLGPDGLVGRIIEAWDGGSKVRLLIDPNSGVGVRVLPALVSSVAQGVAGSDELRVELDENAPPVNVGDNVVTSGIEQSDFPEGLSVGQVTEVEPRGPARHGRAGETVDGIRRPRVRDGAQVGAGSGSGHDHHDDHDDHDGAGSGDHDRAGARGRIRG